MSHPARSYPPRPASETLPRERLWLRAAALGIDLVVLSGIPLAVITVLVFLVVLVAEEPPEWLPWAFRAGQAIFAAAFLARDVRGLSPGKALLGIRVERLGGGPPPLPASALRNLPLLVPGWNLAEAVLAWRRPDSRRLGDRLAGTRVVEG